MSAGRRFLPNSPNWGKNSTRTTERVDVLRPPRRLRSLSYPQTLRDLLLSLAGVGLFGDQDKPGAIRLRAGFMASSLIYRELRSNDFRGSMPQDYLRISHRSPRSVPLSSAGSSSRRSRPGRGGPATGYGKSVLDELSRRLGADFGRGFDPSNLRNMRAFFLTYPIREALRRELSWTVAGEMASVAVKSSERPHGMRGIEPVQHGRREANFRGG